MGNPIFIRTAEGVLLRFEDAAVARRWLEAGRIQWSDRFLGTDQAWHPLSDLLDFSQAGGPSSATPPVSVAAPDTPAGDAAVPDDPRRTAEWASPLPEVRPATSAGLSPIPEPPASREVPTPEITPVAGPSVAPSVEGPTRSEPGGKPTTAIEEPEEEWWASDPRGARTFPARRAMIVAGIAVLVILGVLGVRWLGRGGSDASPEGASAVQDASVPADDGTSPARTPAPAAEADPGRDEAAGAQGRERVPAGEEAPSTTDLPVIREETGGRPWPLRGVRETGRESPGGDAGVTGKAAVPSQEDADTYDAHMEAGNRLMPGRPDAAMAHFRRAAQLRPSRVEPISRMGDLALDQQDLANAERYYREAMRLNAQYGPTILGMARLKQKRGDREDARYWYTRYLERFPQGSGAAEARAFLESP